MYGCRFTIIGCGGIMSVKTAQYKINAGADLLQLITGLIYKGPSLVKKICKGVTI
jgi:dihydroorotate dehydrogenase